MRTRTSISLLTALLALASQAGAQTSVPAPGSAPPTATPGGSGGQRAILVPYGPYVTQTGAGAGGADISEVEPGFGTLGFKMDGSPGAGWRIADDVTVPTGQTWDVSGVRLLAYQEGSPTVGTFTDLRTDVWNDDPLNGGTPWLTVPFNMLSSQVWTGVYRVDSANPTDGSRPIIELISDWTAFPVPPLGPGPITIWFSCAATGSTSLVGPEAPVQVPWDSTNNGRHYDPFGAVWSPAVDGATGKEHGFLFQIEGKVDNGVSTFCTSRPSSIPGCVPVLDGPGDTLSKSGVSGFYLVTAEPVPGGGGKTGILIYTVDGLLSTPLNTAFGDICLSQFKRAAVPAFPGGTGGACDGIYSWDFGAFAVGAPAIAAGSTLHIQAWYRDTGNPGGANITNGIGPVSVVP